MGDFRAEIKIEMTLMGKKYKNHWGWINYFDNGDGIDQRVVDWFSDCWEDTVSRRDSIIAKQEEQEELEQEKNLYLELKKKYEPTTPEDK